MLYCGISKIRIATKKSKELGQALADLSLAHRRWQAKCQLVQTSY